MLVWIEAATVQKGQLIPVGRLVVVDIGLALPRPKKVKIKKAVLIDILSCVKFLTRCVSICNDNFFSFEEGKER